MSNVVTEMIRRGGDVDEENDIGLVVSGGVVRGAGVGGQWESTRDGKCGGDRASGGVVWIIVGLG